MKKFTKKETFTCIIELGKAEVEALRDWFGYTSANQRCAALYQGKYYEDLTQEQRDRVALLDGWYSELTKILGDDG